MGERDKRGRDGGEERARDRGRDGERDFSFRSDFPLVVGCLSVEWCGFCGMLDQGMNGNRVLEMYSVVQDRGSDRMQ